MNLPSVTFLTDIPSPYQVELLGALPGVLPQEVKVIFCRIAAEERCWSPPSIAFEHTFLKSDGSALASEWVRTSDLVIFGSYASITVQQLMWLRKHTGKAWAFWGERPGAHHKRRLGRVIRVLAQLPLRLSKVPIWGIGTWAVEGYRQELGADRLFLSIPYYSNLSRFFAIGRPPALPTETIRFLYSGSLIKRKGVDILAEAFVRLCAEGATARLTFLGAGLLERSLREMTRSVTDRVEFLGFKQWEELPQVYAAHDVLCAPSRYDGWGLVVPEGLASGMPVIATDSMGSSRDLITSENGWIVRAGDTGALLDAMRSAVRQVPDARRTMIEQGRKAARGQHVDIGVDRLRDAIAETKAACLALVTPRGQVEGEVRGT